MKKVLTALALLAASATAAQAEGFSVTTDCSHNPYARHCRTVYAPVTEMRLTPEEIAAQEAEIAKWEAFCKPVKVQDQLGVYRYQYAHKNCDVGRAE